LRWLLATVFTALAYYLLAVLSLKLQFGRSNVTPVWPPSGVAFTLIILLGYRMAPAITIGAFASNLSIFLANKSCTTSVAIILSCAISIGNTVEALIGYYLLQKILPDKWNQNFFGRVFDVFRFFGIALIMTMIAATIGVSTLYAGSIIESEQFSIVWLTWWLGDLSGVLLFTPFLLVWIYFLKSGDRLFSKVKARNYEVVLFFPVVVLSSGIVFDHWLFSHFIIGWAFWMVPVLVWTSVRFDIGVVVTYVLTASLIALWGTIHNHGPFQGALNESLITVQAFIAIIVISCLILYASVSEQRQIEEKLRLAGTQLETRVVERTAELAAATERLQTQNYDLEKINAELKAFSYVASHDLQEPLRKIQTIAMRILEKEKDNLSETGQDYFFRLHAAAKRMQRLIEDLLSYSRTNIAEKTFEVTDLNKIVDEVKEEFRDEILHKSAQIDSGNLVQANVIPFQFRQLMHNLVSNSLKFSIPQRPPRITIKSEMLPVQQGAKKNYCRITVADNGIGFEAEHRDRVFEIFQRLHDNREYPGTGVGLAICKKIVENHNGSISVDSETGKGTTFYITIPTH
jgi:signal transduction histidine kinase